jgi:hypothetical protein
MGAQPLELAVDHSASHGFPCAASDFEDIQSNYLNPCVSDELGIILAGHVRQCRAWCGTSVQESISRRAFRVVLVSSTRFVQHT